MGVLNSFLPGGGEFAHKKNCLGDGQAWYIICNIIIIIL